jgi:hypothetical protein
MHEKIRRYQQRFNDAWAKTEEWSSTLRDAYKYVVPQQKIHEEHSEGDKRGAEVLTAVMADAVNGFVGKMVSGLTPKGVEWVKLTAGPEIPKNQQDNVSRKLEDQTRSMFKYLDRSNFYSVIAPAYRDWAIGTAVLACNEVDDDDNPLQFEHVPIDTVAFEYGPYGKIQSVYRKFNNFYIRNIVPTWPRAQLSDTLRLKMEMDDNAKCNLREHTVYDPKSKSYNYVITTEDGLNVLLDETWLSTPYIVFRYSVFKGDTFGRGVVLDLIPEIKTFNTMRRDILANGEMSINPPILAYGDSIVNAHNIQYAPGAVISVEPLANGDPSIQQFVNKSNFQPTQFEMENIVALIRKALFTDPIGAIDSKTMTATEVMVRVREIQEKIGPAVGLFYSEGGDSLVDRVTFILRKRGLMKNIIVDNKIVATKYKSPLSLSQGMSDIAQFEQLNAQLVQTMGQDAARAYKVEELPMWMAERLSVDPTIINSAFEMQQQAQAMAQLIQPEAFQSVRAA